jgi:hypothetical protein
MFKPRTLSAQQTDYLHYTVQTKENVGPTDQTILITMFKPRKLQAQQTDFPRYTVQTSIKVFSFNLFTYTILSRTIFNNRQYTKDMNITEDPSYTTTRSAYIELEQKH